MYRKFSPFPLILIGIAVASTSGCGGGKVRPPMAKVHGRVEYNGKPVAGATVNFIMEGAPRVGVGRTDSDGNYELTTYDMGDGAIIGPHKVTIKKIVKNPLGKETKDMTPDDLTQLAAQGKVEEMLVQPKGAIPSIYSDVSTTPLQFTVDPGDNEKDIELKDD